MSEPNQPRRSIRWWHCVAAGLVHSILTAAAFPPFGLWPTIFLAPIPLMWAAARCTRAHSAGWLAALGVLPFWAYEMTYVIPITAAGYVPMIVFLTSYTWLFVWGLSRLCGGLPRLPFALLSAVAWFAIETLRGDVLLDGLPWFYLSHPMIDVPFLAAPARLVGTAGLSLIVAGVVGGLAGVLIRRTPRERRVEAGLMLAACLAWAVGSWVGQRAGPRVGDERVLHAAVVQTNLPQSNKLAWTFENRLIEMSRFEELTRQAAAHEPKPDVIVWPETMFPGSFLDKSALNAQEEAGVYFPHSRDDGTAEKLSLNTFAARLFELQREAGVPMVVGAIGSENTRVVIENGRVSIQSDRRYNSAFIIDEGIVRPERFDKVALTPFGEYMPVIERWPWLQQQLLAIGARGMAFDLARGTRFAPLDLPRKPGQFPVSFAAPICFEVTRADHCRRLVFDAHRRRANLIINLTNDGWFGDFAPSRAQHLQLARWRSLELGTPMIRAANTGISAVIDSRGRVLASGIDGNPGASKIDGVLHADIPNIVEETPYARYGNVLSYPLLVTASILCAISLARIRRGAALGAGS